MTFLSLVTNNFNQAVNSFREQISKSTRKGLRFFGLFIIGLCMMSSEEECAEYAEIGHASYYASKFQGRRTSSGEVFSHQKYTAAHATLPFGTIVRVTNLDNDSTVYVKINDRLPKKAKRLLDLTKKAAKELNFIRKGTTQVIIEKYN